VNGSLSNGFIRMSIPAHVGNIFVQDGSGSPLITLLHLLASGDMPSRLETYQVAVLTPLVVKGIGDGNKEQSTKVRMC
jgi:hypothetical protein